MSEFIPTAGTVYIIGAGPGAPDLIAVRGRDIIAQADLVLYADSLVEYSVADIARKENAEIVPSSGLHLEQMVEKMIEAARAGKVVARIHSGDPALYGATHEQMVLLEEADVPFEIVPGITAAFAAAAQLGVELTIPDVVQTIILTRTAGRTTMPEKEDLQRLASAGASLAIYLSVTRIKKVVSELVASGGYTMQTPCAVLHRTTWPDESYVIGTLADIAPKVRAAGYTKHALILVSPALDPSLKTKERRTVSHLYDKTYTHRFRKAADRTRRKEVKEQDGVSKSQVKLGEKHLGATIAREGTAVISVTKNGTALAQKIAVSLDAEAFVPAKFAGSDNNVTPYEVSVLEVVKQQWQTKANLLLVMPTGVAMRSVGALMVHKSSDPAVISLDEAGQFVIPLLGGHQAGANQLAGEVATLTGGTAVITTASDTQGKPALDLLGQADGWKISSDSAVTHVSAALVNEETVGLFVEDGLSVHDQIAPLLACNNVTQVATLDELDVDTYAAGLVISHRMLSDHHRHLLRKSILYRPPVLVAGIGCKRGVDKDELRAALIESLRDAGLALESVGGLSSAEIKHDEAGLVSLADELGIPLELVAMDVLEKMDAAAFSPSAAQTKFGIAGVAEPTAVHIAGGNLLVAKRTFEQCTVAIAQKA